MKRILFTVITTVFAFALQAADIDSMPTARQGITSRIRQVQERGYFNHLDFSVTLSNVGIGFDLATPLGDRVTLRAGGSFRPNSTYDSMVRMEVGENMPQEEQDEMFGKMLNIAHSLTDVKVSRDINMTGGLEMLNFKLLAEIYPIAKHKNFHVTAGFYWGNGTLVEGINTPETGTILAGANIYNAMYEKMINGDGLNFSEAGISLDEIQSKLRSKLEQWGKLTIPLGRYSHDVYYNGTLTHKAGDIVRLTPDGNDMIRMDANVNSFKPYLGIGYSLPLTKDERTKVALDVGWLFWGGRPSIETTVETGLTDQNGQAIRQTIDLTRDVEGIEGAMKSMVDKANGRNVMPCITLRLQQRIW